MMNSELNQKHIAVVEDDTMLAGLVQQFLQQQGLDVSVYGSAEAFNEHANLKQIDLIVCDINMPEMSGFDLCRQIRPNYHGPFIFLTARKDEQDQIEGLDLGADDFISKPVKPELLLARIKASLRSSGRHVVSRPNRKRIELEGLLIDKDARICHVNSVPVSLTTDELDLLWLLATHRDDTVTRDELFVEMIGRNYDGQDRTMDGRVSRLRKKFNALDGNLYEIKTVWRQGYVLTHRNLM